VADESNSSTPPSEPTWLDRHVAEFEQWFVAQQKAHGMEGTRLIQVEHAILRSYITWQRQRTKNANDQAQRKV
jgi:hypothetical protein